MPSRHRWLAVFCLVSLVALPLAAVDPTSSVAGHWEGAIQLPGSELQVQLDLRVDDHEAWSGAIDIPAQNAKQLPLGGLLVAGDHAKFTIQGIPGDPTFDGHLSADGTTLEGSFEQGTFTSTFHLTRAASGAERIAGALLGFREQVQGVLGTLHVPGAAIAVVRNDEVVFLDGVGKRDVEANQPVTPDTLFPIGSATKAFTTLLLGTLVDQGKLDWDHPVIGYLPEFRLEDPVRTEQITVRDLVTHRSGLPRHDLVWYRAQLSREEIVRRLRFLDASYPLRERFQYQNGMFVAAGVVAERLGGGSWESLVRSRILDPLGMKRTNFRDADSRRDGDFAEPYQWNRKAGELERVDFTEIPGAAPAGAINSSPREMAQWLRLQLDGGAIGSVRLVQKTTLDEMHRMQIPIPDSPNDPEFLNRGYGMGWFVEVYRGHKMVEHGGNIDGFSAEVMLLPADHVGIVVLTNANGTPAPEVIAWNVADRLLGLDRIDWLARVKARLDAAETAAKSAGSLAERYDRKPGTHPAHALADYAGDYEHPAYGRIHVETAGPNALAATFHGVPIALQHWHYETFRGTTTDKTLSELKLYFLFRTNEHGDVDAVSAPLEPAVAPIVFTKRPPARLSDPTFLAALAGKYALTGQPGVLVDIALQGDRLVATVPGQPTYTLEPYAGTEFKLVGLTGFSVRFLLDAKGGPEKVLFIQPNGVFEATPRKQETRSP